jgi:hypothetical protein
MDPHEPQALAGRRVADLVQPVDRFDLRVVDADFMLRELLQPVHGDQHVLIDRRDQDRPAVTAKMSGVIGATPEEADPDRGLGDDHALC